jgi:hypothetical protein
MTWRRSVKPLGPMPPFLVVRNCFDLLLTKAHPFLKSLTTRGDSMDQALMIRIRERAYQIWEASGGHADHNWLRAETEILELTTPRASLPSIPKEQRSRRTKKNTGSGNGH